MEVSAAAYKGSGRCRVVRRAKGVPAEILGAELSGQREHGGRFQRRFPRHRWQQAG